MRTRVVTVATDVERVYPRFKETAGRLGVEVEHLGVGERFGGKGWRLKKIWEELNRLPGEFTHILYLDSHDVVFMAGLDEIEHRFGEFGHPWVFGAERVCSPVPEMARLYPPSPTPYKFLNAGGWMGEIEYVLGWFRRMGLGNVPDSFHDQAFFSSLCLTIPTVVKLDYYQKLVFNACKSEGDLRVGRLNKRVSVVSTASYPSIVHGNGRFDLEQLF